MPHGMYGQNRPDPGRTPFGGLSGAIGAGMTQRTPAFFSLMEALQRGAQRAGQQQPGEPEEPNFMSGLSGLQGPVGGTPAAARGTSPGMRSGIGMQTGAGFPRSMSIVQNAPENIVQNAPENVRANLAGGFGGQALTSGPGEIKPFRDNSAEEVPYGRQSASGGALTGGGSSGGAPFSGGFGWPRRFNRMRSPLQMFMDSY